MLYTVLVVVVVGGRLDAAVYIKLFLLFKIKMKSSFKYYYVHTVTVGVDVLIGSGLVVSTVTLNSHKSMSVFFW